MNQYVLRVATAAALFAFSAGGCICGAPPVEAGTLGFGWSFEGETNCDAARVLDLDIDLVTDGGTVVYEADQISCSGGGITIQDLDPGSYEVFIDAFDPGGAQLYAATVTTTIGEGSDVDLGTVDLGRVGAPDTGDIAFYWDFDGAATCTAAGVDEVDVRLIGPGNIEELYTTFPCSSDQGLIIEDVAPDTYELQLDAYTSGNEHLFTADETVTVTSNQLIDLGIVYLDRVSPTAGDLLLAWTFEGDGCNAAGVDEVDVELSQNGSQVSFNTFPCSDGSALLTGLEPGTYTVFVDGYNAGGDWLYTLDTSATIDLGLTTDLGTVDLNSRATTNAVTFLWSFLYPTTLPETDCGRAGVESIEVTLDPVGVGTPFVDTVSCDSGSGMTIDAVGAGDYTLRIRASGMYNATPIDLFDSGLVDVTVVDGMTADVGELELARVPGSFANIDVSWTVMTDMMAGACSDIGANAMVAGTITRLTTPEIEDDTFMRDCTDLSTLRETFVPGTYRVDLTSGDFTGTVTIDAAPGADTAAGVVLAGDTVGAASVGWTFNGQNCTDAGVTNVEIDVMSDGNSVSNTTVPCGDNMTTINGLAPGTYNVVLTGEDGADMALFTATVPATVSVGATTALGTVDLM